MLHFASIFSKNKFCVILALHSLLYSLKSSIVFSRSITPFFKTYHRSKRSLPFLLWYKALILVAISSSIWYTGTIVFPENHLESIECSFSIVGNTWKCSMVLISTLEFCFVPISSRIPVCQFG